MVGLREPRWVSALQVPVLRSDPYSGDDLPLTAAGRRPEWGGDLHTRSAAKIVKPELEPRRAQPADVVHHGATVRPSRPWRGRPRTSSK